MMFFLKKYKGLLFISACVVFLSFTIMYHFKYDRGESFLRKVVLEMVSPVYKVLSASIHGVKDAWTRYLLLVHVQEENQNLKKRVKELEAVVIAYQEGYEEAKRLRKLLSIAENVSERFVAATVIGKEQAALSRTLLINKGASDGLKNGMPVVAYPGLVGRLINVSWHVSRVLLLIDENSSVDAIVQRNRTQGIVSGGGSQAMIFKYVSKTEDVQEGDVIISSGMGGVFPKGWLIGKVIHVDRLQPGLFLKIQVAPFVDFSKLEEVLVLVSENHLGESK